MNVMGEIDNSGELFVEGVSAKVDMHLLNTAPNMKFNRRQICLV